MGCVAKKRAFPKSGATLRVLTSNADVTDIFSIYKVRDGQDGTLGASAPMAFLSNENLSFAANANGQVAATTRVCDVVAYQGASKVRLPWVKSPARLWAGSSPKARWKFPPVRPIPGRNTRPA